MQGSEFVPIKPNIIILDEFLNGDKYVYLHQIPPYVFDKPLDYFDKTYNKLNSDHDKYFLEEEKYEGNDLYDEYNKVEKKVKQMMIVKEVQIECKLMTKMKIKMIRILKKN